ncbi:hypothetical protein [Thiolapillus sp.]
MFSLLFKRKPPLDEASLLWLFDVFGWSFRNFSPAVFYQQTRLVLPTNEFFPGKVSSVQGMAELVFERVAEYAGMGHWPWQVVEQSHCYRDSGIAPPAGAGQAFPGDRRLMSAGGQALPVVYDMRHVGNPETLIAGFAHRLGQYLGQTAKEPPPGGVDNWPQATEVVAVYLGFGLMFANSAFVFPSGGCGSCNTAAPRDNALSQWDCTYALALFTVLKGISPRLVRAHLKKSLRSYFTRCVADVSSRERLVQRLQGMIDTGEQPVGDQAQA